MGFRGWGRNSIKNHSLTHSLTHFVRQLIYALKPGLNTFFPYLPSLTSLIVQSHAIVSGYVFGGRYKGENLSNYFSRFKIASCPCEAWWLFDPKPDRNLPLWSQKWKENMIQNIRLQRNGRRSPRSDNNMNDSCVKIYLRLILRRPRTWNKLYTCWFFLFHPRPRKFRNVRCFECKLRTMSYYGASRDFWKQSCSWMEV